MHVCGRANVEGVVLKVSWIGPRGLEWKDAEGVALHVLTEFGGFGATKVLVFGRRCQLVVSRI